MKLIQEKIQQAKKQMKGAEGYQSYFKNISECMRIQKFS